MQVQNMRAEVSAAPSQQTQPPTVRSPPSQSGLASPQPERSGGEGGEDHQAAWAREEQQVRHWFLRFDDGSP